MARAGRKTKMGAKRRDPNRTREQFDVAPTAERAAKIGHYDFPVDGLLAREQITEEQHRAALEYLRLRVAVFGKPHARSASIYARIAGDTSPGTGGQLVTDQDERTEARYNDARESLVGYRRRVADAVDNTCVYLRPVFAETLPELREGLEILANAFGYKRRAAA
jgi:hypothetical protein